MADNPTSHLPSKILLVDNDQAILNTTAKSLEPYKISVLKAHDWESALYQFNQNRFDVCAVNLKMEILSGLHLIQKWRSHEVAEKRKTPFVLILPSAKVLPTELALANELGDLLILQKPYQLGLLLGIFSKAVKMALDQEQYFKVDEEIQLAIKQKKESQAIQLAKDQMEPLGEKGQFRAAQILENYEKWNDSLPILEKLESAHPQNMLYPNELGKIYLKTQNLEKAKLYLEKADAQAPQNINRIRELALLYLETKEPEKSVNRFQDLVKLHPESKDVAFEYSMMIFEKGFAKHARDFCTANSTPRELVRYFNNKGVLLAKEEKLEEALKAYQYAVDMIPGHKELHRVYYNMALSCINQKNIKSIEKAHEYLKETLKLAPDFEKAKEKLALTEKYLKKSVGG